VSIGYESAWAPEPVWTFRGSQKYCHCRESKAGHNTQRERIIRNGRSGEHDTRFEIQAAEKGEGEAEWYEAWEEHLKSKAGPVLN
jgi:hypothetical protein